MSNITYSRRQSFYHLPSPTHENAFIGRNGSRAPKLVLRGAYVELKDIEGTNLHTMLGLQNVLGFVSTKFEDCVIAMVHWFYKHVKIAIIEEFEENRICFSMTCRDGLDEIEFKYGSSDLQRDFWLASEGFMDYRLREFPDDLEVNSYEDLILRVNNVTEGEQVTDSKMASSGNMIFLRGDERFLVKVFRHILLPTKSHDDKLTRFETVLLQKVKLGRHINWPVLIGLHMKDAMTNKKTSTFPYGGLACHILRFWRLRNFGEIRRDLPLVFGKTSVAKQGSINLGHRLVQEWEVPSLNDDERALYYQGGIDGTSQNQRVDIEEEEEEGQDEDEAVPMEGVSRDRHSMDGRLEDILKNQEDLRERFMASEESRTAFERSMTARMDRHEGRGKKVMKYIKKIARKLRITTSPRSEED